jgi:hypothetical protein
MGRSVFAVTLLSLIATLLPFVAALGRLARAALVAFLTVAATPVAASAASATPALLLVAIAIGMRSAALGMAFAEVLLNHGTFRHRLTIIGRSKVRRLIATVLLGTEFARLMSAGLV